MQPITLFLVSSVPLQYAVLRSDGKLYDFTSQGWDAIPSTGIPAAVNLQAMTAVATTGPMKNQLVAIVPDILTSPAGLAFLTFSTNADGSLTQHDCIGCINAIEASIRGGMSR